MNEEMTFFYNRILDVTSFGSILTKPFCFYILVMKTPKYMRTVSYFIINELGWNFLGNLIYTLGHPIPMMPAACFRIDGLASNFLQTEFQRFLYFTALATTVLNCCLGFIPTFIYRYVTLAFLDAAARVHPFWGFLCCAVLQLITSFLVAILFFSVWLPTSEYRGELPQDTRNLFCYEEGPKLAIVMYFFYAAFGVFGLSVTVLGGLCVRELWVKKSAMSKTTLLLQKEIVKNLLIITGSALFFASLPFVVVVFFIYNSKLPFAWIIVSNALLFPLNFGTVYALLIFILFKSYRKTVVDIVRSVLQAFKRACAVCKTSQDTSSTVMPLYLVSRPHAFYTR
uniref:G_PROTEIN_RECEP_F1_2 domain-containing protein n=1 Tax=Steinernema glaseri TaxID=37863 RepID=A0A1I8AUM8_9BILA